MLEGCDRQDNQVEGDRCNLRQGWSTDHVFRSFAAEWIRGLTHRNIPYFMLFADRFQGPLLVKPDMSGSFYRKTLVQADGKWFVMTLCGGLDGLVQVDSGFHQMHGERNVITFIIDSEKSPRVLGFSLMDELFCLSESVTTVLSGHGEERETKKLNKSKP